MSDEVSIDSSFVRFGGKSYALGQITSVEVRSIRRGGCLWAVWFVMSAVFLLGGLGMLAQPDASGAYVAIGIGLLLGFVGVSARSSARRTTFTLVLATSGAEVQALQTTDGTLANRLKAEIEAAIAAR